MANVNVTYEEMTAAANRLMTGEQDITTQLNELKSYIGNLVSSGFVTDQASVKFNETYTNFTTSATQTIGALDGLAQYLTQAAQAMQETDSQLAAGLGQ
ncbi:MAG: WXG100 family type VII secretion target [Propionibacteriaceae bacterium]|nr:WXG100 family type VII secretion target [Propionibacteriaceae bacterium]